MKKLFSIFIVLCFLIALAAVAPVNTYGATTASLTGPSEVRAGDTITLTLRVSPGSSRISGVSGEFTFDSSQVSYTGKPANPPSGWKVESGDKTFTAYDDSSTMNKYITGNNVAVFTAKFKVNSNVSTGTKISISVKDIITSYNFVDTKIGTATYTVTIAPPKSANSNLKSLTVNNAALTPNFSSNTTSYQTTVPFSVSKLDIKAEPEDAKATVSISGNSLNVGNNTVTITVTAENGAKKEYKITVVREQDPNYVPSSEARLKSLIIGDYRLSPPFSQDVTSYVVYLPYEAENVDVSGEALDGNASVAGNGKKELVVGDNEVKVTVTAEDGKTTKDYFIKIVRMPKYGETLSPSASIEESPTVTKRADEPAIVQEVKEFPVWVIAVLCVACFAAGAAIAPFVIRLFKNKKY